MLYIFIWGIKDKVPPPLNLFTPSSKMNSSHAFENVIEKVWTLARVDRKQSSKKVSSQSARRNSHARQHRNTNLYTSSWREGGIICHIKFSQQSRRWGMSPHSNLLHTQQVLTSRLSLACCEYNSSGRQCLIRMHTDSSYPIPVF